MALDTHARWGLTEKVTSKSFQHRMPYPWRVPEQASMAAGVTHARAWSKLLPAGRQPGRVQSRKIRPQPSQTPDWHRMLQDKPGPPACPPPAVGPPAPELGVPPSGPRPGTGLGTDGPMWGAACSAHVSNPWGQGTADTQVPKVLPPPLPGLPVSGQDRHRRVQGRCPLSTRVSVGRTQDPLHALVSHPADSHTVS